jgi:hypothetical protein
MSTSWDENRRRGNDPRDIDAADERLGDGTWIDRVVSARDAFLEGVELHLSGQRIASGIGHLTPGG